MHRTIKAFLIATTLLQPASVWAETPSEAGAKKIEKAMKTYGPRVLYKPGLLRVNPDGDVYRVIFDMAELIEDAVAPMTIKEAPPRVFELNARPDGIWDYNSSGPFKLTTEYLAADRSANLSVVTDSGVITGVFDPAIIFPRQADIGFTNGVATLQDARDKLKFGIKDANLSSSVKDLPDGHGNVEATFSMKDVTATHGTFPQPEVKISAARIDGSYTLGKLDLAGLAAVLSFWQVKAPGQDFAALSYIQREDLKALFAKHAPVIDEIGGTVVATDLATSEGGKGFNLERLEYHSRWEGLGARGALVMGAHITNLGIDPGIWPNGIEAILPKEAALNVKVSGFDMGALWKDLGQLRTKNENALLPRDHYSKILLPNGTVTIDITDSFARSRFYDVTLSGQVQLIRGERERATAQFTVTARDLDGTVKYLQDNAAGAPIFGRFALMAMMMRGFGKSRQDGTMVWEVRFDDDGKVTVNGQPLPMK